MDRTQQVVGQSYAFLDSIERASSAAALNRPVLVIGERGTGKELIAERLHRLSPRWAGPLITMNCAALAETLIEAELFGHEAGAFTGATKAREGRFEEADGGTLFLDELATLSAGAQERLLRAVEYGEVTRIGANKPVQVDVRIVAATNEHLPGLVEKGRFRADLLDRLAFEVVTLPPLRAREGDVPVLADHFGRRMASEIGWHEWPGFSAAASEVLATYDWPGNVRELKNVIERAVVVCTGEVIQPHHLSLQRRSFIPLVETPAGGVIRIPAEGKSLQAIVDEAIHTTIGLTGGNLSAAARILGISRPTLARKLRDEGSVRRTILASS